FCSLHKPRGKCKKASRKPGAKRGAVRLSWPLPHPRSTTCFRQIARSLRPALLPCFRAPNLSGREKSDRPWRSHGSRPPAYHRPDFRARPARTFPAHQDEQKDRPRGNNERARVVRRNILSRKHFWISFAAGASALVPARRRSRANEIRLAGAVPKSRTHETISLCFFLLPDGRRKGAAFSLIQHQSIGELVPDQSFPD